MDHDRADAPLRLSLTLPGSASLGAFQAGAVSVIGETIDELRSRGREVHVDAIGGASAGAIVSLLFAHCLAEGLEVAPLMHEAWVERVDVDLLRASDQRAPLGFEELRRRLPEVLGGEGDPDSRLTRPIALHIGLTNLLGLTYPVETAGSEAEGITYVDWGRFELSPGGGMDQLVEPPGRSPVDLALASASHPGAFLPASIDRGHVRSQYEANHITNFPDSEMFWFTDGGLVEAEPLGRVLKAAREQAGDADGLRLHLVVDPRSAGPSGSAQWHDPDATPSWLAGVRRALSILPTQALHDDLKRVAVMNERIATIDAIVDELAPALAGDHESVSALAQRYGVTVHGDVADTLRSLLRDACGVGDKEPVDVEVISPLLQAEDSEAGVSELLAGDLIGAFGGFLSRELRRSDFRLGWRAARSWVPAGLERHGVPEPDVTAVCRRLDRHPWTSDEPIDGTDGGVSDLGIAARLRLARLAGRVGRILVGAALPDVIHSPPAQDERGESDGDVPEHGAEVS